MIDAVKTLTVADAVAEKILQRIDEGELVWGQKLPSQRDLAKMLNVGVSSLREGLQILQAMGFVEVKRGEGTYITENSARPLSKNIARSVYLDVSVQNLMEAREVLDTGIAVLAAKKADEEDIVKMRKSLLSFQESLEHKEKDVSKYDMEFHLAMVRSVKNPLLEKFSYVLGASMEEFIGHIEHTKKGVSLHQDVLNAIGDRNSIKARDAMLALLKHTREIYLKHLYAMQKEKLDE